MDIKERYTELMLTAMIGDDEEAESARAEIRVLIRDASDEDLAELAPLRSELFSQKFKSAEEALKDLTEVRDRFRTEDADA